MQYKQPLIFKIVPWFIGICFVLVIGSIVFNVTQAVNGNSEYSFGLNGVTESRCISGYKHTISPDGSMRQVITEFGKGQPC